jgi:pimeloyl-ACP methyl ester carboxylesterase
LRADLKRLTCSTHCLLSDSDQLVPVEVKDAIQSLNPACHIHVVASAGHALFVSQTGRFVEILNRI